MTAKFMMRFYEHMEKYFNYYANEYYYGKMCRYEFFYQILLFYLILLNYFTFYKILKKITVDLSINDDKYFAKFAFLILHSFKRYFHIYGWYIYLFRVIWLLYKNLILILTWVSIGTCIAWKKMIFLKITCFVNYTFNLCNVHNLTIMRCDIYSLSTARYHPIQRYH